MLDQHECSNVETTRKMCFLEERERALSMCQEECMHACHEIWFPQQKR